MADINNLENFLTDVASAIKNKKGYPVANNIPAANFDLEINSINVLKPEQINIDPSISVQTITPSGTNTGITQVTVNAVTANIDNNITPSNIANGVSILGVTGTLDAGINTADATAKSYDIAYGQTAYVNGSKVRGSVDTIESGEEYDAPWGMGMNIEYSNISGRMYIKPEVEENVLLRENSIINMQVRDPQLANAINLTNDMIANNVVVLGIRGNYVGSGSEDLSNELNAQNLVIANLENQINTLSDTINNATRPDANFSNLDVVLSTTAQSIAPSSPIDGYNIVNVPAVTASIDSNITPDNIVNGVNILGVIGNYVGNGGGATLPNGLYIQANTPNVPQSQMEGLWLRQIDDSNILNHIPPETVITIGNNSNETFATVLNNLTSEQKELFNGTDVFLLYNAIGYTSGYILLGVLGETIDNNGALTIQEGYMSYYDALLGGYQFRTIAYGETVWIPDFVNDAQTGGYWSNMELVDQQGNVVLENSVAYDLMLIDDNAGYSYKVYKSIYDGDSYKILDSSLIPIANKATASDIAFGKMAIVDNDIIRGTYNGGGSSTFVVTDEIRFSSSTFSSIPNYLDFSNVTNMSDMFKSCRNLNNINGLDTSKVTNMSNAFAYCNNLNYLPNLNTSNVTNAYTMFRDCRFSDVPNFDLSNATNTSSMFFNCDNITSVPNFDLSKSTSINSMFGSCDNITSIPNFDLSNVTGVTSAFSSTNITSVPNFYMPNLTNMYQMFYQCKNLVDVPQFDTSRVTSMSSMFSYANNLSDASVQNVINMVLNSNITSFKNLSNAFYSSPFSQTNINNTRYQNRWAELTAAGWTY